MNPEHSPLRRETAAIKSPALRTLTQRALAAAPACFWTMPASTSGKYHPAISLGEGGLVRHTAAVARFTLLLLNMAGIPPHDMRHSIALSAALLHDCCKKSDNEAHTAFDHPLRAARHIRATAHALATAVEGWHISAETLDELCRCVESHMGRWNICPRSPSLELPLPLGFLPRLVHAADYLASRPGVAIDLAGTPPR